MITQTAHLAEKFFPKKIIARSHKSEKEFWDSHNLENGDWKGIGLTVDACSLMCSCNFISIGTY